MQAGQKVPAIKEIIVVLHVAHLRPLIKVCQPSNVQPQRKKKKLGKKKKSICQVANAAQRLRRDKLLIPVWTSCIP